MGDTDLLQLTGEYEYKSFAHLWANLSKTTVPISTHQFLTGTIVPRVYDEIQYTYKYMLAAVVS